MEKETADIAQISFYLAKEDATFDSLIDPEAGLGARQGLVFHEFEVDGAACRFIYFETLTTKTDAQTRILEQIVKLTEQADARSAALEAEAAARQKAVWPHCSSTISRWPRVELKIPKVPSFRQTRRRMSESTSARRWSRPLVRKRSRASAGASRS